MSFEDNENVTHSEDDREVLEVVGSLIDDEFFHHVQNGPGNNPLMTVAQHERIVAAKDAEIAHLSSLFGELHLARNLLSRLSGLGFDMSGEDSFFAELEQLLAPAAVVMPERLTFDPEDVTGKNECWVNSHNATLDEVARLNRRMIPVGLLERWADRFAKAQIFDYSTEIRALLDKKDE